MFGMNTYFEGCCIFVLVGCGMSIYYKTPQLAFMAIITFLIFGAFPYFVYWKVRKRKEKKEKKEQDSIEKTLEQIKPVINQLNHRTDEEKNMEKAQDRRTETRERHYSFEKKPIKNPDVIKLKKELRIQSWGYKNCYDYDNDEWWEDSEHHIGLVQTENITPGLTRGFDGETHWLMYLNDEYEVRVKIEQEYYGGVPNYQEISLYSKSFVKNQDTGALEIRFEHNGESFRLSEWDLKEAIRELYIMRYYPGYKGKLL